jgi:hypothetical protein
MKYLFLSATVLFLLSPKSAMAHSSAYLCQAVCSYDRGHGRENIELTTKNFDEQTAFDEIFSACKNLNGVLLGSPQDKEPSAAHLCRVVWQ